MEHFVCGGCCGVAEGAKVCETAGCSHEHQDLTACNCTDNTHNGICHAPADTTVPAEQTVEEAPAELPASEPVAE